MRLFGPSGLRNQWEDRGTSRVSASSAFTALGGGTDTILFTYTVPTSRRARVMHAGLTGTVSTAFAVGQVADLIFQTRPVAAGPISFVAARRLNAPALSGRVDLDLNGGFLASGNVLEARVAVGVGAGVIVVAGGVNVLEYDI